MALVLGSRKLYRAIRTILAILTILSMLGINIKLKADDEYLNSSDFTITTYNPSGGTASYWVSAYGSNTNYFLIDFHQPFCLTQYKVRNSPGNSAVTWYYYIYGSNDNTNRTKQFSN